MDCLNERLLALQNEWINDVAEKFIFEFQGSDEFSRPFHLGVSKLTDRTKKMIMIVGQEADRFWDYNDREMTPEAVQDWCIRYLEKQIFGKEFPDYNHYNASPFWNFFRKLHARGYSVCWNNLDKIHRYGYKNGDRHTLRLTEEQEFFLHCKYGVDKRTLLLREIETLKPDALVFVTGPHYAHSMEAALELTNGLLSERPAKNNYCISITEEVSLGIPAVWTYHPGYLSKIGCLDKSVASIVKTLDSLEVEI